MKFSVYVITNTVTGKKYVGKTGQPGRKRLWAHTARAKAGDVGCRALYASIRKHGSDAFLFEVVAQYSSEKACLAGEREWISKLNTVSPGGYNLTAGGEGPSGRKQSEQERKARGDALRGRKRTTEVRTKLRVAWEDRKARGWSMPEEGRQRISAKKRGYKHSDCTKAKMSAAQCAAWVRLKANGFTRGPLSVEHRAKISVASKRQADPAKRAEMSKHVKAAWARRRAEGKDTLPPITEAHREKLRIATRRYWERKQAEKASG